MSTDHAIAQLRHLYAQMIGGHVRDTRSAATGILGPSIEELEAASATRDADALRKALRGCLAYLWPAPEEGHTGFVDRLGIEFYRETGIWPHFKSAPMDVARDTDHAEAQNRWSAWLEAKRNAAAAAAARSLEDGGTPWAP